MAFNSFIKKKIKKDKLFYSKNLNNKNKKRKFKKKMKNKNMHI